MSPRQSSFSRNKAQIDLPNGITITIESALPSKLNLSTPLGITEALRLAYYRVLEANEWIFPGIYARQWIVRKLGEAVKKYINQILKPEAEEQPLFLILMRFYHLSLNNSEKIELISLLHSEMEEVALLTREFIRTKPKGTKRFDTLGLWTENTLMLFGILANQEPNAYEKVIETIIKRLKSTITATLERSPSVISSSATPTDLEQLFEAQQKEETDDFDDNKIVSRLTANFIKLAQDRLETKEKIFKKI